MESIGLCNCLQMCQQWKILSTIQVVGAMIYEKKTKFMKSWGQNYCAEELHSAACWQFPLAQREKSFLFYHSFTCNLLSRPVSSVSNISFHQPFFSIPIFFVLIQNLTIFFPSDVLKWPLVESVVKCNDSENWTQNLSRRAHRSSCAGALASLTAGYANSHEPCSISVWD